jgi:hypothetical protein
VVPGRRIIGTYGGFVEKYIGNYFTGAVKNEKNNWKGVVSFRVRVGFAQDTCNLVPQSHSSTKVSFLGHCAGAKFDL